MTHLGLVYYAGTLLIGIIVLSISLLVFQTRGGTRLRKFIYYHASFTFLATLNLVSSYLKANVLPEGGTAYLLIRYLENPGALLLMMFTTPLFVHSLVPLPDARKRNLVVGVTTLLLLVANYTVSLFDSAKVWDQARIILKDVIFIVTIIYCWFVLASSYRRTREAIEKRFIGSVLALFTVFIPGIVSDTFLLEYTGVKIFPVVYCAVGVFFARYFYMNPPKGILGEGDGLWEGGPDQGFPGDALRARDLSQREVDVVRLLLEGKTYKAIGEDLFISPNTVKTHSRNAYQKIGVKNRLELARFIKTLRHPPV